MSKFLEQMKENLETVKSFLGIIYDVSNEEREEFIGEWIKCVEQAHCHYAFLKSIEDYYFIGLNIKELEDRWIKEKE